METKADSHVTRLTLNGAYTPKDYFEEPVSIEQPGETIALSDGGAEVTLKRTDPVPTAEEQKRIFRDVEWLFKSQCVLSGRPYDFTGLSFTEHFSDGRRNVSVSVESNAKVSCSVVALWVAVQNPDGSIVDPRAEQLARDKAFREKCLKHVDDVFLKKLIASFGRAVTDPANLLVHLYEIRDALKKRFNNDEKQAKQELGISNTEWKILGKLADAEPVEEGRHRGQHGKLRPATDEECSQAKSTAKMLIGKYLDFLDKAPP